MAEHTQDPVVVGRSQQSCRRAAAATIIATAALLSSCWGDCFFKIRGHVIECGTMTAVSMAKITIRIDQGLHGVWTVPMSLSTDDLGNFTAGTASETCDSWGTLMFQKDGFMPLEVQYMGSPKGRVELCMIRSPVP